MDGPFAASSPFATDFRNMPEKGAKIIDISPSRALSAAKQLFGHSMLPLFLIEAADRPTHDFDKLPPVTHS